MARASYHTVKMLASSHGRCWDLLHVFQPRQGGRYRLPLHRSWAALEEALGQSPFWRGLSSLPQWLLPCEQLSEEAGSRAWLFQLCGCFPRPTYTVPISTTGSNEKVPISGTRGRVELAVISLGSALCGTVVSRTNN